MAYLQKSVVRDTMMLSTLSPYHMVDLVYKALLAIVDLELYLKVAVRL